MIQIQPYTPHYTTTDRRGTLPRFIVCLTVPAPLLPICPIILPVCPLPSCCPRHERELNFGQKYTEAEAYIMRAWSVGSQSTKSSTNNGGSIVSRNGVLYLKNVHFPNLKTKRNLVCQFQIVCQCNP